MLPHFSFKFVCNYTSNSCTCCKTNRSSNHKTTAPGHTTLPNQAFEATSTAVPESPPDDGLNLTDVPENHLHKINVGELVSLSAIVNGVLPQDIQNIQWTISEPKIKDYDEKEPGKFNTSNITK